MIDFNSLLPVFGSVAGGAIGAGVLSGPIKSLDDWWYYQFGKNTELKRKEAELLTESKVAAYKKDIYDEVIDIPAKNIKEPQLNIIGPALEASKYYIDSPELRKMFAKLVASSMDSKKEGTTRSVFVDFVKQMSPFDAKLLSTFSKTPGNIPIAKIQREFNDNSGMLTFKSNILTMETINDISERNMTPSAIINLSRMGLVDVSYSEWLTSFDYDNSFSKTPEYAQCNQQIELSKVIYNTSKDSQTNSETMAGNKKTADSTINIGKGCLTLTTLGTEFTQICI